jgi:hypothetical protein
VLTGQLAGSKPNLSRAVDGARPGLVLWGQLAAIGVGDIVLVDGVLCIIDGCCSSDELDKRRNELLYTPCSLDDLLAQSPIC